MNMETGTRTITLVGIAAELGTLLYDARWLIAIVAVCLAADFRFGWGESSKRHEAAVKAGDTVLADKYKWHTSRAVRRTMNKLMDYIAWIVVGISLGKGVLDPLGVDYRLGGVAATAIIACLCELPSAFGHFFYLHGVKIEKRSVAGFAKAFAVAFARRKSPDIGDAMEEGFREMERKDNNTKS